MSNSPRSQSLAAKRARDAEKRAIARRPFARALATTLRDRAMSQTELANRLGTTQSVVSAYATGESSCEHDMIYKIEDILGVTPGFLSRHVGCYPEPPESRMPSLEEVVEADPTLSELGRATILAVYRLHSTADVKPAARKRRAPAKKAAASR